MKNLSSVEQAHQLAVRERRMWGAIDPATAAPPPPRKRKKLDRPAPRIFGAPPRAELIGQVIAPQFVWRGLPLLALADGRLKPTAKLVLAVMSRNQVARAKEKKGMNMDRAAVAREVPIAIETVKSAWGALRAAELLTMPDHVHWHGKVVDQTGGVWVPLWLVDRMRELSPNANTAALAVLVYTAIADAISASYWCRRELKELAAAIGYSGRGKRLRAIERAVALLEELRLIEVERSCGKSSVYRLRVHEWMARDRMRDDKGARTIAEAVAIARAAQVGSRDAVYPTTDAACPTTDAASPPVESGSLVRLPRQDPREIDRARRGSAPGDRSPARFARSRRPRGGEEKSVQKEMPSTAAHRDQEEPTEQVGVTRAAPARVPPESDAPVDADYDPCPRCSAAMEVRHRQDTARAFLGCVRFQVDGCRGTRPMPRAKRKLCVVRGEYDANLDARSPKYGWGDIGDQPRKRTEEYVDEDA